MNLGFTKSSSKTNSHNESAVVTTIRGKDENSSITYNNVKNIDYIGTQARDDKFIYNNVENINKKAVELNNSYSSNSKSNGISAGVTINYNNGFQAEADAIRVSGSKSKMNTDGTNFQNGLFVNIDEEHNNTKNMTLSGFNQVGGKVTGNIQNLTIESKQSISTTTGSTKSGSIGFAPNGIPNSISANYSQTNGERRYVDTPTTFIIGEGSNLKVGKVENTAGAIGNAKLSIDEYIGHNLENKDKTTTKGASLSLSPSKTVISGVGINYANKDLESVTKNTVVGNVEIGKSSGDETNKDLSTMTEVTKDEDTKTNVFVESQTIKYALNPESFKEDLQVALIEGKATGRTVVKTIDNIVNGDKSQDIGEAERRSLIEIKEAIIRVQTAPAMDIIAEEDLADKNVQARLKVEIEKFDPNDPTLSEKVKERLNELMSEGKEIVAFYDKVTGKIFVNKNAKNEEIRASIAREYKIKEDLELGRGKENDKGQLRSTVAGEIAYDEIKDRLKKGDKNPISASSFDIAKMDKDSEVTSDKYGEQVEGFENIAGGALKLSSITSEVNDNPEMLDKDPETRKRLYQAGKEFNETYNKNIDYMIEGWHRPEVAKKEMLVLEEKIAKEKNPEMKNLLTARYNYLEQEAHPIRSIKEGFVSGFKEGSADAITLYAASKIPVFGKYVTVGTIIYGGVKHAINAAKEEPKIAITFKQANDIKRIAPEFHKDAESSFIIGKKSDVSNSVLIGAAEYYYKNNKTPDKRLGNSTGYLAGGVVAYKGISIAESKYNSLKTLTSDPNLVSANEVTNGEQLLLENKVNSVQGKVFINDGTPGGTTVANQIRFTDSSGNMLMLQNNLTTGELSLQGINSSGQRIFEKSLTPYPANALIGTSSSSQMLVGDGAVSQVQSTLIPKANVNNMDLLKAFKRVEGEKNYYYSKLTTTKEVAGVKFRFPSIEYALNERAAEELQKNPLTMPIEMQEHIFGEIKHLRNGTIKATGGHAVSDQVKISDITNIQYNNVFQAKVEIYDPVTNQYILKSNNNGLSTFFPVYWTKDRILIEAESAFGNKVPHSNPNMLNKGFYEGKTKSGVKVDIGRKTLYPQERQ